MQISILLEKWSQENRANHKNGRKKHQLFDFSQKTSKHQQKTIETSQ